MNKDFSGIITSEMVSPGHPDKIADLIADEIAFAATHDNDEGATDRHSRCAIEVMLKDDMCIVAGEVKNPHIENFDDAILEGIKRSGYTSNSEVDGWVDNLKIINFVSKQSAEISDYVDGKKDEVAAGDQGIIFGYAVNETDELLPKAVKINQLLLKNLSKYRGQLRPDMKCQTSMVYEDGRPVNIKTIVVAVSYNPSAFSSEDEVKRLVSKVVRETVESDDDDFDLQINPFTICGPSADTGLTGRKLISDTYQGYCPHGGGAISGKDLSKVDRSAAYYTRMIAKHVVAAGLTDEAIIQMGFSIGHTQPVSISIECRGRNHYPTGEILAAIEKVFKLDTTSIFNTFINEDLGFGEYGWFADQNAPWERINPEAVSKLKQEVGK